MKIDDGTLILPIELITKCLPIDVLSSEYHQSLESSKFGSLKVSIPIQVILQQLQFGKIELTLKTFLDQIPRNFFTEKIDPETIVKLPLREVVERIPKAKLIRNNQACVGYSDYKSLKPPFIPSSGKLETDKFEIKFNAINQITELDPDQPTEVSHISSKFEKTPLNSLTQDNTQISNSTAVVDSPQPSTEPSLDKINTNERLKQFLKKNVPFDPSSPFEFVPKIKSSETKNSNYNSEARFLSAIDSRKATKESLIRIKPPLARWLGYETDTQIPLSSLPFVISNNPYIKGVLLLTNDGQTIASYIPGGLKKDKFCNIIPKIYQQSKTAAEELGSDFDCQCMISLGYWKLFITYVEVFYLVAIYNGTFFPASLARRLKKIATALSHEKNVFRQKD